MNFLKHQTLKLYLPIIVAVLVVLGAVGFVGYKFFIQQPGWPTSSHFALVEEPVSINWNYTPLATDAAAVEKKIDQIATDETIDDYERYVSLAGEYNMLGNGAEVYKNLLRAVDVLPSKSLAYLNLGNLLEKVGATASARSAFERAVTVESQYENNHNNLIQFYTRNYSTDTELIEAAFKSGLNKTGDNETLLKRYAQWLSGQKRYDESIVIWQKILRENGPTNSQAIKEEITHLERLKQSGR